MKTLLSLSFIFFLACNNKKTTALENEVDSLKKELNNVYKPGLGEFMSSIQMHHAKLWFAGINGNWQLADFEMHEIREIMDDIEKYCADRPETKSLRSNLSSAIDSMNHAIGKQDVAIFKEKFLYLTSSCNDCHRANAFGINVVTIPTAPPVTNQDFKAVIKEVHVDTPGSILADSTRKK